MERKRKSRGRRKARAAAPESGRAKRPIPKRPKSSRVAVVVDRPGRRHAKLIRDRLYGSERKNLAKLRLGALREKAQALARHTKVASLRSGTGKWVQLGPTVIPNGRSVGGCARINATGRVTAIVVDPGSPATIYVAAARGGVWKTLDGGVTWSPKSDQEVSLALGALAMAPSDHSRLYAGTGEGNIFFYVTRRPAKVLNEDYHGVGVLRSGDGGDTWTHVGSENLTGKAIYRIAVDPTNPDALFAATTEGLMRSQDGGTAWTVMKGLPTGVICSDVAYHPGNPRRAWCALWGSGIYRTDNADVVTPTWTKLGSGLPASGMSRIALAVAASNPNVVFAIVADARRNFKVPAPPPRGLYRSADGGDSWSTVPVAAGIQVLGPYTLNIAVDVSTPDVVYVSGLSLYRCVQSAGSWSVTDIGKDLHPDNHAFASHPTNNLQIYAGNDAGIYQSADGGSTWDDTINEGLIITQFEFIGQHPCSDAQLIGGTQDNGTAMFQNSLIFYHSADGDGGQAGIDPANPKNVIHTDHYTAQRNMERSTEAGKFGTYTQDISIGRKKSGSSALFYAPWTYEERNSNNLAFGLNELRLSASQGTDKWPTHVPLPGIGRGLVSAIHYVNSSLIYCGTSNGLVYKAERSGSRWAARKITAPPLPARWIWDIFLVPRTTDILVLAMAGYQTPHIWKGTAAGGAWTWRHISGTRPHCLPDAPANALQIDPAAPQTMYAGCDVGVWMTSDGGTNWYDFNDGLPHAAVYDLKLHAPTRLLRAATHGRGLWERKLDHPPDRDVRIVVRNHAMDTGRIAPSPSGLPAAWEDARRQINLGDSLFWWNCADVKIDSPLAGAYQKRAASVDYLAFETALEHRNPQRGAVNRVYVQVHNRGAAPASNVVVKILCADAAGCLPDLPADFWIMFPADSAVASSWLPIGAAQKIPSLRPERPAVLEWDWTPPLAAAVHPCLLVVTSCNADPPAAKSLAVDKLVMHNRQVGLKNLHIIDARSASEWSTIRLRARSARDVFGFTSLPKGWSLRLLMSKNFRRSDLRCTGLAASPISAGQHKQLRDELGAQASQYDMSRPLGQVSHDGCTIRGIPPAAQGLPILVSFTARKRCASGSVQLIQESEDKRILGGTTFVLRGGNSASA